MPDVDGIELLRFLRGNDAFAAVPVVSECLPGASDHLRALYSYWERTMRTYSCSFGASSLPWQLINSGLHLAVMSANEENDTVFECIRGGAEDYLLKPVTRKEVQHIWQHVWRRQQQLVVPSIPDEVSPQGSS